MVVKVFYDGGNEADSRQYDYVTLAAFYGVRSVWKVFDEKWAQALKRHNVEFLHTTYLMTFNGIYSRGWSDTRRNLFLNDCADLILVSASVPHTIQQATSNLIPFSVTIDLKDFKRLTFWPGALTEKTILSTIGTRKLWRWTDVKNG